MRLTYMTQIRFNQKENPVISQNKSQLDDVPIKFANANKGEKVSRRLLPIFASQFKLDIALP